MTRTAALITVIALAQLLPACTDRPPQQEDMHAEEPAQAPTNRVDIPAPVRSNLGITFVDVEARRVDRTLRIPGRFELLPTARREYRTMLPGRVELLVDQFESVEAGSALYTIESPAWRELQQKLAETSAQIDLLNAKLSSFPPLRQAHATHERGLKELVELWNQRVRQLEAIVDAGGGRTGELAEARSALAQAQSDLGEVVEKDAQLDADQAEARASLNAAKTRRQSLLATTASLLNIPAEQLSARTPDSEMEHWATIDAITVTATEPGIVEMLGLTNGAWADEKSTVLTVIQPDRLRFHAQGLQSDLSLLTPGLPVRIVPPTPTRAAGAVDLTSTMTGALSLGLNASADDRTIDVYTVPDSLAPWARQGVAAQLEIITDTTAQPALAIPLAAVQRDGLSPIIFRRDPADPNKAIRLEADLGLDDGRWVVVNSGLMRGDQVVLDGAFQLMLATSGSASKGGHFHADGTFHAEDH